MLRTTRSARRGQAALVQHLPVERGVAVGVAEHPAQQPDLQVTQRAGRPALGVSQENVSRIERADEPQLSTMRRFIEALGGELIVQVRIDGETFDLLAED